ncbi:ATP-dependent Clp protease ATP-binding subunit [Salinifilum ghardaiensis]
MDRGGVGESSAAFDSAVRRWWDSAAAEVGAADADWSALLDAPARRVLTVALRSAVEIAAPQLDTAHLLWAATQEEETAALLSESGVDVADLAAATRRAVDEAAQRGEQVPALAPSARRALAGAHQQARREGASVVGPRHLLLGLATDADSAAGRALARAAGSGEAGGVLSPTPRLDEFGWDVTAQARAGGLDPVVGRDEEIEQAVEILGRRGKNNPLFLGDPGVGKTAVVEGLAQRVVAGAVPPSLARTRIVAVDMAGMVAGARYRGEFEQRFRDLLEELRQHRDRVMVFVDEVHSIVGAGAGEGSLDAGTMLKPALARGEVRLLGATTVEEYRRHIARDAALERRFAPIMVEEPSTQDAVSVLEGLRERFQQHHQVQVDAAALSAAVQLSQRYLPERFLPDKAVDVLDQTCSRVRLRRGGFAADVPFVPTVGSDDVGEVVARRCGVPVGEVEPDDPRALLDLEQRLQRRVLGQDRAVRVVSEAVRRARAGLGDPDRPIGGFVFLGPTGVGKTELARALAEALFGDTQQLIRLDMSEYQEKHAVSRLVGAPPGYVGHGEAGELTDRVRRQRHAVVLLDEVEKAHPDVFHMLLQVLDAGRLTDAQGRTVDFRDAVIIMTSNLGADAVAASARGDDGHGGEDAAVDAAVWQQLRAFFRPEFLNRVDDVVTFRPLGLQALLRITESLLQRTAERLQDRGVEFAAEDEAVTWLVRRGWHPEFGARPLRRVLQQEVDNRLAGLVLSGEVAAGHRVTLRADGEELTCVVSRAWEPVAAGRHAAGGAASAGE